MINTLKDIAADQIHNMADNYISQTNASEAIKRVLGELNAKIDDNYNKLNAKIDALEIKMDQKFNRLEYAMFAHMMVMIAILFAKI